MQKIRRWQLASLAWLSVLGNLAAETSQAKVTAKVLDESGKPVENALVTVGFEVPTPLGLGPGPQHKSIQKRTNADGLCTIEGASGIGVGIGARKDGYYWAGAPTLIFKGHKFGRWEPWNPTIELVLKSIIDPIPMLAKHVNIGIPEMGKPLGFDLSIGDWVSPYGRGRSADMIFEAKLDMRSEDDFDYTLTVSFPNKGDGIQTFETPSGYKSELRSPHTAPDNGYKPEWVQKRSRRPGQMTEGNFSLDRNYFFRVRSVLDQDGIVLTANYGKIYGDFMDFTYYLNPTPNDQNVEFDPKRNILTKLKSSERVVAP